MMIPRRSIIVGLGGLIVSPAVVRATSIMTVKGIDYRVYPDDEDLKGAVIFTIYGWDKREQVCDTDTPKVPSQPWRDGPIAIHLTQSWQASWS
jgi:hypothetical protein